MVRPSDDRWARTSQNSRRETGSTPVVGSSSSRTRGCGTSAQMSESFCLMPPLNFPARRPAKRCMSNMRRYCRPRSRIACGSNAAQVAAVADVFGDGEVGIEAEGLGEVAGLRAHLARGPAEDVGDAGGRFHHAGENLEGRGLARAIGADEAEYLARLDCKADAAHGLERAVALGEAASFNGWRIADAHCGVAIDSPVWSRGDHLWLTFGHVLPSTRTSPSTGIPGLANPKPDFNCSLTPTTCLTRSSRK